MPKPSQISILYNDVPSSDTESETEPIKYSSTSSKQKADQSAHDRLMLLKEITPKFYFKENYQSYGSNAKYNNFPTRLAKWLADFSHILEKFGFESSNPFNESTETGPSEEEAIIVNSVLIQKTKEINSMHTTYKSRDYNRAWTPAFPMILINRDPRKNIIVIIKELEIDWEEVKNFYSLQV